MKKIKHFLPILFIGLFFSSCSKDDEFLKGNLIPTEPKNVNLEVKNFIYRGLNDYYLYKADVPELADTYFSTNSKKENFLESFNSPENLFENLKSSQDHFSFMFDDYVALENLFSGVSTTTGMSYVLSKFKNSDGVFGFVRYVLPGTSAEEMGIERGDFFTTIDGVAMNINNYQELLGRDSYTVTLATLSDNTISETNETVTLVKRQYNENPVFITKVIEEGGKKIGYLMYNSFTADYDNQLNAAFAELKAAGVDELILDLRYNGGGSVLTATRLASMITGQFTGEVFMREEWNKKWQAILESQRPEWLVNKFTDTIDDGQTINSLKLNRIYVLTTGSTASASELIINGLEPYIDVVQIGTTTTGKFQASVTLYDSPDFSKKNVNKNHTYAIQPLVLKSVNADGKSDYVDGLTPDIVVKEDLSNLGVLGDPSETMLNAALNHILGKAQKRAFTNSKFQNLEVVGESGMENLNYQKMYIDEIPALLE